MFNLAKILVIFIVKTKSHGIVLAVFYIKIIIFGDAMPRENIVFFI